ncbi:MAG: transporter substrate-binding domain-containing protein [Streptococcus sp.]|nr:transporter substrate-binding domain-containing protein [Streptococcus sp.]
MKKCLLTVVALASIAFILVACSKKQTSDSTGKASWEQIQKTKTLKVATSGTLYPQSYHDDSNKLTGYDVEILKEVGKRLKLKVEFEEMGVDGMLSALKSGKVDIAGYSEKEGKNANKFLWTDPHKYSFTSMIVRKEDNSGISSLKDIKGKKAAGAASTNYMKIAKKLGAELVIYDNVTNDVYMNDIVNGRTDVIINDYYLQSIALTAFPDKPIKILEDVYFNPTNASFSLSLDNKVLLEKVNGALEEMRKDGTLTKLSEKFFAGQDVSKEKKYDFETIDISDVE